MHKLARHIQHYVPLIAVLAAGLIGFILFPYDKSFQGAIIIAIAAGYVTWGIVHHYLHGDLEAYIVAEYGSIALIGIVIVFSLLYG
jgi:hypothetical protein